MSDKDEIRFIRLEDKVDGIKEDINEVKVDMRVHMQRVETHISQDEKIINHIGPVLEKIPVLTEIAEAWNFEKELKKRKKESITTWSKRLGVISLALGIVGGIIKLIA